MTARPVSQTAKLRLAGSLFLLLLLVSACTEFFARGRLNFAMHVVAGALEVSCMISVTLLLYSVFRPTQPGVALLATGLNCAAVLLELLQVQPHGLHFGIGLHGLYWILLGWLMLRSGFLPRLLCALPFAAGLAWFIFCARRGSSLARGSMAVALSIEAVVMLAFLLVKPARRHG